MGAHLLVYDDVLIGRCIAWGSEHSVYDYAGDKVIKFSLIEKVLGEKGTEKIAHDLSVCRRFFGEFLLETQLAVSKDRRRTAVLQQKMSGHGLVKRNLRSAILKEQFEEILKRHDALTAAGYAAVDLIGQAGFYRRCFSNIWVVGDRLRIIDASLIEVREVPLLDIIASLVRVLLLVRQESLIRDFLRE